MLRLRRSRLLTERAISLITGGAGFSSSVYYFGRVAEFDPTALVFGVLDPQIAFVGASFAAAGVAWVAGSMAGGNIWRILQNKETLHSIDAMDTEFFQRLQHHRPKEFHASLQNPVPDYYGEKITSMKEYRTWLKNQRNWRVQTGQ